MHPKKQEPSEQKRSASEHSQADTSEQLIYEDQPRKNPGKM
jgi:hypothetical protein